MYLEEIATQSDIDYLMENIFFNIFPEYSENIDKIRLCFEKSISNNKNKIIESHYYFIKEGCNSKIIGIIGYYKSINIPNEYWLGWFGLLKEYQRQGYGTTALNHLLQTLVVLKADGLRTYISKNKNFKATNFFKNRCFIQDSLDANNDIITLKRNIYKILPNWRGKPLSDY